MIDLEQFVTCFSAVVTFFTDAAYAISIAVVAVMNTVGL